MTRHTNIYPQAILTQGITCHTDSKIYLFTSFIPYISSQWEPKAVSIVLFSSILELEAAITTKKQTPP